MARIRIDLPTSLPFKTEIPVLLGHINSFNHLDNAQLLTIVSEAQARFIESLGFTEKDVEGAEIIVADTALQYRSEAFRGEILQVEMTAVDFHDYGCDVTWRMAEKASGREVARGRTGIVFYDNEAQRKVGVPGGFRRCFPSV